MAADTSKNETFQEPTPDENKFLHTVVNLTLNPNNTKLPIAIKSSNDDRPNSFTWAFSETEYFSRAIVGIPENLTILIGMEHAYKRLRKKYGINHNIIFQMIQKDYSIVQQALLVATNSSSLKENSVTRLLLEIKKGTIKVELVNENRKFFQFLETKNKKAISNLKNSKTLSIDTFPELSAEAMNVLRAECKKLGKTVCYTDGSVSGDGTTGGWGWWINENRFLARKSKTATDSNEMEYMAVLSALNHCDVGEEMIIVTDSESVLAYLKKERTSKKAKKLQKATTGKKITFFKVKGHTDTWGHGNADRLSREMRMAEKITSIRPKTRKAQNRQLTSVGLLLHAKE